jgi:hypothetical protein
MSNKYLCKIATIIDVGPDGEIQRIHSDPHLEARARKAKLVNPPRSAANKFLRRAAPVAAVGAAAYGAKKLYDKRREKRAEFLTPERKKEIAQTGVLLGSGVAASGVLDRFIKPRMKFTGALGKAKYIGLIGGANLAADYGAVKINKAIEHSRTE